MFYMYFHSPIGDLTLICNNHALTGLHFGKIDVKNAIYNPNHSILIACIQQLKEYFNGTRTQFTIPLQPKGTAFQQKVWQQLCQIPYGNTNTYKQIATLIGSPKACRAVGGANHNNPIAIIIPCHRVIAQNGLGGYGGGIKNKIFLLQLEKESLTKI